MCMDLNAKVDSPCVRTGDWGFVGVVQDGKTDERSVPIGVYSNYALGRAQANAWLSSTRNAVRWEAVPMYEEHDAQ